MFLMVLLFHSLMRSKVLCENRNKTRCNLGIEKYLVWKTKTLKFIEFLIKVVCIRYWLYFETEILKPCEKLFFFIYFQGRDPVIISCSIYLPPHKLLLDTINLQFHYTLLSVSRGASYFNGYS